MSDYPTENIVRLEPEGYIFVALIGEQNYQTIEAVGKACRSIVDRLNYEHKPLLGLIDFSRDKSFNAGSNRAAMEVMETFPYQRAAMYGSNPIMQEIAQALIDALGKAKTTKVFGTREEAVAWLLMKDPLAG